jgi:hypothetical protein
LLTGDLFKDGLGCDVEPTISFAPAFIRNTEIFGGVRFEGSMVGFSTANISGGKYDYYVDMGVRIGI